MLSTMLYSDWINMDSMGGKAMFSSRGKTGFTPMGFCVFSKVVPPLSGSIQRAAYLSGLFNTETEKYTAPKPFGY